MIFSEPLPFLEALQSRLVRTLLPTDLRTQGLAQIAPELRARSMFSAGQTSAEFLQKASDGIDALLDGKSDRATQRMELKRLLGSLGDDSVDNTDLTDIRSDARLNLIIDTNVAQAHGYGHHVQGLQADVYEQWPAQELIRVIDSAVPRDWAARWAAEGGQFFGGRMIALKTDPIWTALSRFGTPYPPFDFNSGMDVQDVDRDEAIAAGLIAEDEQLDAPEVPSLNAELQATPQVRAEWLRTALADSLQGVAEFDAAGVLRATGGAS